jgi:hypothetical protein
MVLEPVYLSQISSESARFSQGVQHKDRALSHFLYKVAGIRTILLVSRGTAQQTEPHQETRTIEHSVYRTLGELLAERPKALFYFRYPLLDPLYYSVLRRFPGRIVFEHITLNDSEFRLRLKSLTVRDLVYILRTEPFRLWHEYLKGYTFDVLLGAKVLRYSAGGVCGSKDIERHVRRRRPDYKTAVVGNGIALDEVSEIDVDLSPADETISLLYVCGSVGPWAGVDRILKSLIEYQGASRFRLNLVGVYSPFIRRLSGSLVGHEVIFHGLCSRCEIARIAATCQAGVGTLALHRKGMTTCSTLKVCEYAAMGLPIILDNLETNFPDGYPYQLRFPSNENLLDLDRIPDFLARLKNEGFSSSKMRADTSPLVDMTAKARQIAEFLFALSAHRAQLD